MKAQVILVLMLGGLLHSISLVGQGKPTHFETKRYQAVHLSAKLKQHVAIIEQGNYFTFTGILDHRINYPVFSSFLALDSLAKEKELLFLTQHTHPIVRCYAFWALLWRNHPDWLSILIDHLADPETSNVDTGDTPRPPQLVGDIMLSIVGEERDGYIKQVTISPTQQQVMDSAVLFSKSKLYHQMNLLMDIKPEQRYYARIKQLVVDERDKAAVIALARFRKPEDRIYISTLLKNPDSDTQAYGLWAVSEYPDSSFLADVVRIHQDVLLRRYPKKTVMLYRALVRYETPQVHALLLQTLEDTTNTLQGDTYNQQTPFIYLALEQYPSPYWDELRAKISMSEEDKKSYLSLMPLNKQ